MTNKTERETLEIIISRKDCCEISCPNCFYFQERDSKYGNCKLSHILEEDYQIPLENQGLVAKFTEQELSILNSVLTKISTNS